MVRTLTFGGNAVPMNTNWVSYNAIIHAGARGTRAEMLELLIDHNVCRNYALALGKFYTKYIRRPIYGDIDFNRATKVLHPAEINAFTRELFPHLGWKKTVFLPEMDGNEETTIAECVEYARQIENGFNAIAVILTETGLEQSME